ncbi:MAG: hypothetical protein CBB87_08160 [Micavibrio sp. TMED27]|nr:hypothetical protein [Micavibrio sp.]OUT90644.1 MAG: hypothetical protein CBB87_08160 [Micavibrio sp. TMED27]|tara:strand:+ start:5870 stop:6250 length:381 start_codon:yes stop_codon:yes gene_type:complete
MKDDENILDRLSENPSLKSIALLVGEASAKQLSVDFGGVPIYIPQNPGKQSPLSISVGLDNAQKIAQIYGGMEFTVPLKIGKREKIKQLNEIGKSASEIAREVGCSISHVHRVRAELVDERQIPLF